MIGQGENAELPSSEALKSKREKFTVDLRKQKNQEIFNKKRFRFSEPQTEMSEKEMVLVLEGETKEKAFVLGLSDKPLEHIVEQLLMCLHSHSMEGLDEISSLIIRKFTDNNESNIELIMKMQLAPVLIKACQGMNPGVSQPFLRNSLMILINVLSGRSEYVIECLQAGILNLFLSFVGSKSSPAIIEDTIWGLANIAAENNESIKLEIIKSGILNEIAQLNLGILPFSTLTEMTRFLTNLTSDCCPDIAQIGEVFALLELLIKLPSGTDAVLLNNIMNALFNISKLDSFDIDQAILSSIFSTVYDILMQNEKFTHNILNHAGQFMYNLFSTYYYEFDVDFSTDALGLIDLASMLISNTEKYLMISGLEYLEIYAEAGGSEGVSYIMSNNSVMKELFTLAMNPNFEVRKKALMTFSQMLRNTEGSEELNVMLGNPEADLVEIYCKSISINMSDQEFIIATLNAFLSILGYGHAVKETSGMAENPFAVKIQNYQCLPLLSDLQHSPVEEIYKLTKEILDDYF